MHRVYASLIIKIICLLTLFSGEVFAENIRVIEDLYSAGEYESVVSRTIENIKYDPDDQASLDLLRKAKDSIDTYREADKYIELKDYDKAVMLMLKLRLLSPEAAYISRKIDHIKKIRDEQEDLEFLKVFRERVEKIYIEVDKGNPDHAGDIIRLLDAKIQTYRNRVNVERRANQMLSPARRYMNRALQKIEAGKKKEQDDALRYQRRLDAQKAREQRILDRKRSRQVELVRRAKKIEEQQLLKQQQEKQLRIEQLAGEKARKDREEKKQISDQARAAEAEKEKQQRLNEQKRERLKKDIQRRAAQKTRQQEQKELSLKKKREQELRIKARKMVLEEKEKLEEEKSELETERKRIAQEKEALARQKEKLEQVPPVKLNIPSPVLIIPPMSKSSNESPAVSVMPADNTEEKIDRSDKIRFTHRSSKIDIPQIKRKRVDDLLHKFSILIDEGEFDAAEKTRDDAGNLVRSDSSFKKEKDIYIRLVKKLKKMKAAEVLRQKRLNEQRRNELKAKHAAESIESVSSGDESADNDKDVDIAQLKAQSELRQKRRDRRIAQLKDKLKKREADKRSRQLVEQRAAYAADLAKLDYLIDKMDMEQADVLLLEMQKKYTFGRQAAGLSKRRKKIVRILAAAEKEKVRRLKEIKSRKPSAGSDIQTLSDPAPARVVVERVIIKEKKADEDRNDKELKGAVELEEQQRRQRQEEEHRKKQQQEREEQLLFKSHLRRIERLAGQDRYADARAIAALLLDRYPDNKKLIKIARKLDKQMRSMKELCGERCRDFWQETDGKKDEKKSADKQSSEDAAAEECSETTELQHNDQEERTPETADRDNDKSLENFTSYINGLETKLKESLKEDVDAVSKIKQQMLESKEDEAPQTAPQDRKADVLLRYKQEGILAMDEGKYLNAIESFNRVHQMDPSDKDNFKRLRKAKRALARHKEELRRRILDQRDRTQIIPETESDSSVARIDQARRSALERKKEQQRLEKMKQRQEEKQRLKEAREKIKKEKERLKKIAVIKKEKDKQEEKIKRRRMLDQRRQDQERIRLEKEETRKEKAEEKKLNNRKKELLKRRQLSHSDQSVMMQPEMSDDKTDNSGPDKKIVFYETEKKEEKDTVEDVKSARAEIEKRLEKLRRDKEQKLKEEVRQEQETARLNARHQLQEKRLQARAQHLENKRNMRQKLMQEKELRRKAQQAGRRQAQAELKAEKETQRRHRQAERLRREKEKQEIAQKKAEEEKLAEYKERTRSKIQEIRKKKKEEKELSMIEEKVSRMLESEDYDGALALLDRQRVRLTSPGSVPRFEALAEQVNEKYSLYREKMYDDLHKEFQRRKDTLLNAVEQQDVAGAQQLLAGMSRLYGSHPDLQSQIIELQSLVVKLKRQEDARMRERAVKLVSERIEDLIAGDRLNEAEDAIEEALRRYKGSDAFNGFKAAIAARREELRLQKQQIQTERFDELRSQAEFYIEDKQFLKARVTLENMKNTFSDNRDRIIMIVGLEKELKKQVQHYEKQLRDERFAMLIKEQREKLVDKQYADVLTGIEILKKDFPEHKKEIMALTNETKKRRGQEEEQLRQQRNEFFDGLYEDIKYFIRKKQFNNAHEKTALLRSEFIADSAYRDSIEKLDNELLKAEADFLKEKRDEDVRKSVENIEMIIKNGAYEEAAQRLLEKVRDYPEEDAFLHLQQQVEEDLLMQRQNKKEDLRQRMESIRQQKDIRMRISREDVNRTAQMQLNKADKEIKTRLESHDFTGCYDVMEELEKSVGPEFYSDIKRIYALIWQEEKDYVELLKRKRVQEFNDTRLRIRRLITQKSFFLADKLIDDLERAYSSDDYMMSKIVSLRDLYQKNFSDYEQSAMSK